MLSVVPDVSRFGPQWVVETTIRGEGRKSRYKRCPRRLAGATFKCQEIEKEMDSVVKSDWAVVAGSDSAVRRLKSAILRQQGFAVAETTSIEAAEGAIDGVSASFTLLVASLDIPDCEGLLESLANLQLRAHNLKIILTSSSSPSPTQLELMRLRGIEFLSLPFSFARFCQTISKLRNSRSPAPFVSDPNFRFPLKQTRPSAMAR